ncbi:hypothetical protein M3223_09520 [Paenibacillus pasadenensis]|nr:hypothetical protein [Paenibacillus pasadenensis]
MGPKIDLPAAGLKIIFPQLLYGIEKLFTIHTAVDNLLAKPVKTVHNPVNKLWVIPFFEGGMTFAASFDKMIGTGRERERENR